MSNCDLSKRASKIKVCVMGSGNWGTAIAKIVGENCAKLPQYNDLVPMYVHEERIGGKKLTDIINQTRENVKYLPGHVLPQNVVAVPNNVTVAKNADIIIFVLPHEFVPALCASLLGKIKTNCIGISLVKGFIIADGGGIDLISHVIQRTLKIKCSVLMGANLANEIADSKFAEATIGCRDYNDAKTLRDLFQTDNFRISVVHDADTVEACGALKNIVACGVGFTDGLELGFNTKAAVIRLGLMEMIQFITDFYPGGQHSTFFQSCGVADLIATCFGGRNHRVSEAMVKTGKSLEALEKELLNGQKLQGPATAHEVNIMLEREDMIEKYPLFTAVHHICKGDVPPSEFIDKIRKHPINDQLLKPPSPKHDRRKKQPSWIKPCCGPKVDVSKYCKCPSPPGSRNFTKWAPKSNNIVSLLPSHMNKYWGALRRLTGILRGKHVMRLATSMSALNAFSSINFKNLTRHF